MNDVSPCAKLVLKMDRGDVVNYLYCECFLIIVGCDVYLERQIVLLDVLALGLKVAKLLQRITRVADQLTNKHLKGTKMR